MISQKDIQFHFIDKKLCQNWGGTVGICPFSKAQGLVPSLQRISSAIMSQALCNSSLRVRVLMLTHSKEKGNVQLASSWVCLAYVLADLLHCHLHPYCWDVVLLWLCLLLKTPVNLKRQLLLWIFIPGLTSLLPFAKAIKIFQCLSCNARYVHARQSARPHLSILCISTGRTRTQKNWSYVY